MSRDPREWRMWVFKMTSRQRELCAEALSKVVWLKRSRGGESEMREARCACGHMVL